MRHALPLLLRGALVANRLRLVLTVSCIALGVALAGAVHTVHNSALAEIDRGARALAGVADIEIRGPRSGFDDSLFIAIAARPEVAAASPIVEIEAAIASGGAALRVLGIDPMRAVRLQPAFIADAAMTGAGEATALLDANHVWLTPAAAARLKARAGDSVGLLAGSREIPFPVAGILAGMQAGGEIAVMDIAAAQQHFARLGLLSRIDLRLRPGVDAKRFRADLAAILPPGVVASDAASVSGRAAAITLAYRVNLEALALVALATGAFLVFSTLALQAARRRQEFALLRALGITRRELALLLALEGALIGAIGAALGTALGVASSMALLRGAGADFGAGFFGGLGVAYVADIPALAMVAALGVAMSVGGALWVALAVGRVEIADALRDRSIDLPAASRAAAWLAAVLVVAGFPLLLLAPIAGLPIGGYATIAAWLCAAVLAVGPLCRALLARIAPSQPLASLALAQVRHLPGHLAASVAGIVVSASLCVAMAIMVFSFRVSVEDWLRGVIGADLYVRASTAGDSAFFSAGEQGRVAALAEVARSEPLRYDRLAVQASGPPLSLIARPLDTRILEGFQAEPRGMGPGGAEVRVWISEAARDLLGWKTGDRLVVPVGGHATPLRVAGVIRDYARTWGAVMIDIEDYRRLTGDTRANDLAVHLAPGVDATRAKAAIRAEMPHARGLVFEDAGDLLRRSLQIFDRSFAVTYALEAIAIAIGLAGVTSSFAALAWSRRREFGVLRFLGLTRREVLRILALEGAATGALGAFSARVSAAYAVRNEAVLAVKDDA